MSKTIRPPRNKGMIVLVILLWLLFLACLATTPGLWPLMDHTAFYVTMGFVVVTLGIVTFMAFSRDVYNVSNDTTDSRQSGPADS